MKYFTFIAALLLAAISLYAKPVEIGTAQIAAKHFMLQKGWITNQDPLTHYYTYTEEINGRLVNTMYVFNQGQERFVIVGADDRCVPIIGYSCNGSYQTNALPANMKSWLEECSTSIATAIADNAPENGEMLKRWKELTSSNIPAAAKDDSYLLTSTWEQGWGYNKYCPQMNGEPVVVGCVATAMAQIIRYHQYPSRGFGYKSYGHVAYGQQAVNFDTTEYDYTLMPDHIRWRSTDEEIDMVSRLCRHCGISVNMNYQHAGYTEGSGAQTAKVVDGLVHFGYTDAKLMTRTDVNDSIWISTIRNEMAHLRPIEYAGHSYDGGHAFVLDGFNDQNEAHFNWGWGGYCDGFYSIHTVMGYASNQQMVYNITPSGWDGHLERFYVAADGNEGGTSWEHPNNNIEAAVKINTLINKDIWIKEGIYYGDTTAQYAFTFTNMANIYGGFSGTETSLGQRNPKEHPTIFDGRGSRAILSARCPLSTNRLLRINDIILQNGYSPDGSIVVLKNVESANNMTIRNCQCDSGSILDINATLVLHTILYGNQSKNTISINNGSLRQSLIHHNQSRNTLLLNGDGTVYNCDIVNNSGVGVNMDSNQIDFANNIIWGCDSSLSAASNLENIHYCAIQSDTNFADSTLIRLDSDNMSPNGPMFADPATQATLESADYHLYHNSICVDAGKRIQVLLSDGDLDNNIRCRNGYIDLGCYEVNPALNIEHDERNTFSIYPNPATSAINIEGLDDKSATIYDISGRAVMQIHGSRADVSSLASGIYYLRSQGSTAKFVKQ